MSEGIKEIVETLLIAIVLVILVVYIFLQGWRATLIPLLAVPVSLVGTFLFFPLFGFTINTLSLFGLVLAIGLVVDDAIVVVEGVERHIEDGLAPKQAAFKAMEEISGPVIGIALVLSAVFVPTAFIPGITGRLYQQFAVTIAISVILSAFNALTLSPALAALLLKPKTESRGPLGAFFRWFNRVFERATDGYVSVSGALLRKSAIVVVLLAGFGVAGFFLGGKLPTSFVPDEDQGYLYLNIQLPNAASLQRTQEFATKVENILLKEPGVEYVTSVLGFSLLSYVRSSYSGFAFISLKEWGDRKKREEQMQAIKADLNRELSKLPEGVAFTFSPPAIPGVGTSGGFTFILEDRSGQDVQFLSDNVAQVHGGGAQAPGDRGSVHYFPAQRAAAIRGSGPRQSDQAGRPDQRRLPDHPDVHGRIVHQLFQSLWTAMAGVRRGRGRLSNQARERRPVLRAERRRRNGSAVGADAIRIAKTAPSSRCGSTSIRAAQLNGGAAPGYSTDQAMKALEEVFAQTMPHEMGFDYSGMSFQEKKAQEGISPSVIFGFSLLFVFLILAALYESWSLPFSVLLSTPVAIFGAFGVLWLRRTLLGYFEPAYMVQIENDVYSQIGLVMLIGLAAKNAILIVEFAKDEFENGKPLAEAALEGARLRLRPILMTSFAFILGCVPLWIASGAGSVGRQIMGTTVIGGMMAASVIGIFLIPAIFYVVEKLSGATASRSAASARRSRRRRQGD